jgi:hypothetical protein
MQRTSKKRSISQDILAQATSLDGVKHMPLDEKQNVLALFARHLSRDSEVFARRCGKADEVAVQEGDDPTAADIMVNYLKHLEQQQKMEHQRELKKQQQKQRYQHQQGAAFTAGGDTRLPNPPSSEKSSQAQSKPIPSMRDMQYQARQA